MASDIFISYAPADVGTVDRLCEFLEGQGIRCWVGHRDILPGEDPAAAFARGIDGCPIMILIFSQSANQSEEIRNQVDRAVTAEKVLIPFRIENVAPSPAMEPYFRRRYWHDAHTPTMERHFEELTRMLKPLTLQQKANAMDEASISRTLPSRSSIVKGGTPAPALGREQEGPLRLSFNFNHIAVAGYPSIFDLQVENVGPSKLEHLEVAVESRGLKRGVTKLLGELGPGGVQLDRLEIEAPRSGHFVLHLTVKWQAAGRQMCAVGSRAFRVNETPSAADLAGGVKNLMGNSNKPGAPVGTMPDLGEFVDAGTIRSLDSLLGLELPESFEPLVLTLDNEVGLPAQEAANVQRTLQIPAGHLGTGQAGTVLVLEALGVPAAASPYQDIRLVARPSFNLGRLREESDYVLWFWPRNQIHDTKTRRISKRHCNLTAKNGRLSVNNTAAASLTTFDGQEVTGPEGVIMERRGDLNLSGIYFLDVVHFPSACPHGPMISNLESWGGKRVESSAGATGSVRFSAVTPHVLAQNSTWLLSDATFGTSRANPIVLNQEGLAEIQGRFHHFMGSFWIESLAENEAIKIGDEVLHPGSISPLADGQTLRLGETSFRLTVSA